MISFGKFVLSDENDQWDLGIFQWFAGTVIFLGMSLWSYGWKEQAWAPMDFGAGLLGVLGAGAALQWIRVKAPTEKVQTKETDGNV